MSLSAKLSAAYDAALVASEAMEQELPGTDVRVLDSGTAASSQALIVLAAVRAAAAGESLEQVENVARSVAGKVRLLAVLDTQTEKVRITNYDTATGAEAAARRAIAEGAQMWERIMRGLAGDEGPLPIHLPGSE